MMQKVLVLGCLSLGVLAGLAVAACGAGQKSETVPAIKSAPPSIAKLRVYAHVKPFDTKRGKDASGPCDCAERSGGTGCFDRQPGSDAVVCVPLGAPDAFLHLLQQDLKAAGLVVVTDERAPYDVDARIDVHAVPIGFVREVQLTWGPGGYNYPPSSHDFLNRLREGQDVKKRLDAEFMHGSHCDPSHREDAYFPTWEFTTHTADGEPRPSADNPNYIQWGSDLAIDTENANSVAAARIVNDLVQCSELTTFASDLETVIKQTEW
jgi:hypothetical protein